MSLLSFIRKKYYVRFIILVIFLTLNSIYSIGNGLNNINLRVTHYTTENGLSQNYIDYIYKDSRGFLWFGTWYGLNRFDGYNFITYRPKSGENSISDGFIHAIVEDKEGNLWIATRNGINKYIFKTDKFIHFTFDKSKPNTSISENWITSLVFDKDNNLWIGTLNSGIEKITFNKELTEIKSVQKFTVNFLDSKGISSKNIYSLLLDHSGNIYIGSLYGLDRLDPKTGEVIKYQDLGNPLYFEAAVVHSLFEDHENILWIGIENGLLSIDFEKNKIIRFPIDKDSPPGKNKKALSNNRVNCITEDLNGRILIGTLDGLFIYDKKTEEFSYFPENKEKEYSLNNKFINSLFCDKEGNVWIGTEKGGVNKYNVLQKKFYFFAHNPEDENSLDFNLINTINENDEYVWIGTAGGGLNRYNKKLDKFDNFKHIINNKQTIGNDFISAIACNNNEIWIGTWGRAYCRNTSALNSDKLSFKTYEYNPVQPDGPPFIYVSAIIYDKENPENVWIGRTDKLELYDRKTNQTYSVKAGSAYGDSLSNIGCLYIDSRNYLWIGSPVGLRMFKLKKGLSPKEQCEPDSIFTFINDPNDKNTLSGNFVVAILEDKMGKMWFSVYGNGICRLDNLSTNCLKAEFSNYTTDNGLSNNVVFGMLEDNHNNLWLSTDWGLTKYNYITNTSFSFFESDGIQSNQFYWAAYFKNKDGILYFGGTKGVNYFNPDSIKSNAIIPQIVITDFKLFNQSQNISSDKNSILKKVISETSEIRLHYNQNSISFEFAALCYESSEKNQYKYKLDGFDKDWIYANSDRRFASYTNLDPGVYYFLVTGTNNDGIWNPVPTSVKIVINPPWWGTIWFRILYILLFLGVLILIYKIRTRTLLLKKIELEKLVQERTSELNEKTKTLFLQTIELDESNKNLKKINDTKDKLMAIIAHDLKNPFNVILGMLDLLKLRYDELNDDKKKKYIDTVNTSSKNLYKLLENLLHWARAQTGNFDFKPIPFILNNVLKDNINLMEGLAKEKNISLSCNCSDEIKVFADINLINTVVRNLLNNAIKYTRDGSISITTECLADKRMACVRITDTGVGIEQQKLLELFETNNFISFKGTNGETGTGLGLHVCYEFILRNGGTIHAESEVGKGTSFIFTVPLAL